MHHASKGGVLICCLLAFAFPSLAKPTTNLSLQDDGIYVSEAFAKKALEKRNIYQTGFEGAIFIKVEHGKVALSNAHELWDAKDGERFEVKRPGNRIEFSPSKGEPVIYLKIKERDAASYFFNRLFKGCYKDQDSNKFCFSDNSITDKKVLHLAQLELDPSELDIRGNNLKIEGDKLHWVFIPTARGWNVYLSDWASAEGYVPFDKDKPWLILTRQ